MIKKWTNKLIDRFRESRKDPSESHYVQTSPSSPQLSFIVCAGLAALVFLLYYQIAFAFCTANGLQDMKAHAKFALEFYLNPEVFFSFAGPLIMRWYSDGYMGQFTPNPLHNPTHIACKGFGLLAMMAGIDIIRSYRNQKALFFKGGKQYFWFGLFSFFSVLAKPTFMYMLLPAGIIMVLLDLLKAAVKKTPSVKAVWSAAWRLAVAALPSCAYILTEYIALFFFGTESDTSVIFTKPLEVWHFFSYDVPTSILLGMFFPIWMLLTNLGYFYETVEGRLSVLGYMVGVLEFSVLAESGSRKDAGNFSWCMMAGMTLFFTVSVCRLTLSTLRQKPGVKHAAYVLFSWFLLFLHVYSGLSLYNVFSSIL